MLKIIAKSLGKSTAEPVGKAMVSDSMRGDSPRSTELRSRNLGTVPPLPQSLTMKNRLGILPKERLRRIEELIEWLCDSWGIEKRIDAPDYIVGLGSGVLRDETGSLTRAGKNVVDKCFSLYHLCEGARGIVVIGGKPWRRPPFSDAELMHGRLLGLNESGEQSELPADRLIALDGYHNTYEQACGLRRFLSDAPGAKIVVVCPRLQSRRLRALLGKQGLLGRAGIATVDDGCEPLAPVEKFRWSERRYLAHELLAFVHHMLRRWI